MLLIRLQDLPEPHSQKGIDMNRWEINHSRGHASHLKELFDKMTTHVESVIILAENS